MHASDFGLLALRTVLGSIIFLHGVNHWRGGGKIDGTAGWFSGLGLRYGRLQAWVSVIVEMGAGVMILVGVFTPIGCAAALSVMLVAGILAHRKNGFFIFNDGYEYVLLIAVVAVSVAVFGPGRISVDSVSGIVLDGWPAAIVTAGLGAASTAVLLAATWRPNRVATSGDSAAVPPVHV